MIRALLSDIELERHLEALARMLRAEHEVALLATPGGVVTGSDGVGPHWLASLGEGASEAGFYRCPVAERDGVTFDLVLRLGPQPADPEHVRRSLACVAGLIESDLDRLCELDEMADELGARYEELNLIYRTEREESSDESTLSGGLRRIIDDSRYRLGVNCSVLYLPSSDLELIALEGRPEDVVRLERWHAAREPLSQWLRRERATVVLNQPGSAPAGVELPSDLKAIATPIDLAGKPVHGLFAILRDPDSADFTNGDRKLVNVLADRISNLVQRNHDHLTGVLNRQGLESRLEIQGSQPGGDERTFVLIDIDQLKLINDTLGYAAGDELLRHVAALLGAQLGPRDLIARVEGDEFALVLHDGSVARVRAAVGKAMRAVRESPMLWDGRRIATSTSVGIVPFQHGESPLDTLLLRAQSACVIAKRNGRDRMHVHDPSDPDVRHEIDSIQWVPRLRSALDENRFVLYAQPVVPLDPERRHEGYVEVLLRFLDERGELCAPGPIIAAAERYQMMAQLDRWVVERVLELMSDLDTPRCAVNLSAQSLSDDRFRGFLSGALRSRAVSPSRLGFEITETAAITSYRAATDLMRTVSELGYEFSLDDFGTGLASFTYLRNLPIGTVKIDGSFVRDVNDDPVSAALVGSVCEIARVMDIRTVAEYVENDAILERVRAIGVDYAQGYGIGRPAPMTEVVARHRVAAA